MNTLFAKTAFAGLPPGRHTLQLIVGDKSHIPLNPTVESQPITVSVQ